MHEVIHHENQHAQGDHPGVILHQAGLDDPHGITQDLHHERGYVHKAINNPGVPVTRKLAGHSRQPTRHVNSPIDNTQVESRKGVAEILHSIHKQDDKRDGGNLWRCLRRRGRRYNRRAGKNAGRGLIPNRIDISERPAIVARKTRLGDWEGDTVVGAGHKGGLLTLVERKTQLSKIIKLPRATASATQKAAVRCLKPIGNFVHTITFDNGKEFAAHQDIAHALKAKIFFATPYHAWERGLNENTNGLIRDSLPKGTDFSTISNAEVAKVERLLNARPRKSLGFRSPQEVFHSLAYS